MPKQNQTLVDKLFKMLETLELINVMQDLDKLLGIVMKSVKDVMHTEASSLVLLDPESNELYFNTVEGGSERVKSLRIGADQGIAGHVLQTKRTMVVNDVTKSKYFLKTVDRKTKFKTRSIICAPLITRNKVIGVIQAVNKLNNQKFSDEDQKLFDAFAHQVAVAIDNARLYNMAFYDPLTKAFRRKYFEAWLAQEFSRVKRYKTDLSLVMFDIDFFKQVNDTHGHAAGDTVLRELAQTVRETIRQADVFARYGGEEFVICLPETKPEKAKHSAERIRKAIEKQKFVYDGMTIPVTISLGVASFRDTPEDSVTQFMKDVDEALYQSKREGRNRVTVYVAPSTKTKPKKKAA